MRWSNGVSAFSPQTAWHGTPAWRARTAISPAILPSSVVRVEPALAGDDRAGGAHALVEPERLEDERGARLEPRAERRPQPARQAARRAGHRHAARVARQAGARASSQPLGRAAATAAGSAPFCGANTSAARSNGVRTSHSTTSRAPRRPPAPRSPRSRPRRRRSSRCRPRRRARPAAPASTAAAIELAGAVAATPPPRRARLGATRARPLASATSTIAVPPSSTQREPGPHLPPERVVRRRARGLAAERGEQHLQRPLAAVGDRAQVGRLEPGALDPAADGSRDLGRAERALEAVGRDEQASRHRWAKLLDCGARARGRDAARVAASRRGTTEGLSAGGGHATLPPPALDAGGVHRSWGASCARRRSHDIGDVPLIHHRGSPGASGEGFPRLLVELVDRGTRRGSLSSRQRWIFAPWRMRPSLTWSNVTSTTSSGRSAAPLELALVGPAARLARAALAGLVGLRAGRRARASPSP